MKLTKLIILVLLFSILTPVLSVQAQEMDYVADAIEALKTSSVYVAPGTPETDYNTPNQLTDFIKSEDNVVLVMLPSEVLNNTDLFTVAQKISEGLNNQKTIGLAIGNQLIGYSLVLPRGIASELMTRADSTSNNTITALEAFSRNVQLWLIRNPQPIPTPTPKPTPTPRPTMQPIELPKTNDVPLSVWGIFVFVFFTVIVTIAVQIKKARDKSKYDSIMSDLEDNN